MASLTNVYANYRSTSTDYTGRLDIKSTASSLSESIDQTLVNAYVPIGSVFPFAGSSSPPGFLICDGTAVSRLTYVYLFNTIGTTYGVGDGSTTFNIPNLKGRIPVGLDAAQTEFDTLGETGGTKVETLTVAQMPSHNHTGSTDAGGDHNHTGSTNAGGDHNHTGNTGNVAAHTHDYNDAYFAENTSGGQNNLFGTNADTDTDNSFKWRTEAGGWSDTPDGIPTESAGAHNHTISNSGTHTHVIQLSGTHTHGIQSQGGGQSHNNLQPYIVLNYIIRY